MKKKHQKLIVIVGPTASGKSDLAVAIARAYQGEIISADSRQIYRGLDVGTGKVPGTWKNTHTAKKFIYKSIPHYCIDSADPKKQYSVAMFQLKAKQALKDIASRGKLPIVAGGTGFWIDAFVYDMHFPEVAPNIALRKRLEHMPTKNLYALILKKDPRRAKTLDKSNKRRLIRSLEIIDAIGTVPRLPIKKSPYDTLIIGIDTPAKTLAHNIHRRLHARVRDGMIQEARLLHKKGLSYKRMRELGLEYRHLADLLQKKVSKTDFLINLEKDISAYAKRQMTWFRRDKHIHWIQTKKDAETLVSAFLKN